MVESFGITLLKVRDINFFVGSALAGFAGVWVALLNNLVEPTMGSVPSYKALAIIVLGGLGSVPGTLAAALVRAFCMRSRRQPRGRRHIACSSTSSSSAALWWRRVSEDTKVRQIRVKQ